MNPYQIQTPEQALETAMLLYITANDSVSDTALVELQEMIELLANDLSEDQIEKIKAKVMRQLKGSEK